MLIHQKAAWEFRVKISGFLRHEFSALANFFDRFGADRTNKKSARGGTVFEFAERFLEARRIKYAFFQFFLIDSEYRLQNKKRNPGDIEFIPARRFCLGHRLARKRFVLQFEQITLLLRKYQTEPFGQIAL